MEEQVQGSKFVLQASDFFEVSNQQMHEDPI